MEVKFNTTTRQKIVFGCLQTTHTEDFLLAQHIDRLGQHMSHVEHHTSLNIAS
jgi:hypothetical protein